MASTSSAHLSCLSIYHSTPHSVFFAGGGFLIFILLLGFSTNDPRRLCLQLFP